MNPMFAQIAHLWTAVFPSTPDADLPHALFEEAGARCGSNPHQASELRAAALAYLRVVR